MWSIDKSVTCAPANELHLALLLCDTILILRAVPLVSRIFCTKAHVLWYYTRFTLKYNLPSSESIRIYQLQTHPFWSVLAIHYQDAPTRNDRFSSNKQTLLACCDHTVRLFHDIVFIWISTVRCNSCIDFGGGVGPLQQKVTNSFRQKRT